MICDPPKQDLEEICSKNSHFFKKLSGMRVLITGGTGFIGNWLVTALLESNHLLDSDISITTISRSRPRYVNDKSSRVSWVEFDLSKGFPEIDGQYDAVFLLANPVNAAKTSMFYTKIARAQTAIARKVVQLAANQSVRIVHTSSGAVYGRSNATGASFNEREKTSPDAQDRYAQAKIITEKELERLCQNKAFPAQNPRLFTFYGPGQPTNSHFAIGNFLEKALAGTAIEVRGHPETTRSYMYQSDLISYLIRIAASPSDQIVNIGSQEAWKIRDLARLISNMFGSGKITYLENSSLVDPTYYWPDTKNLRAQYGGFQETPIEQGLERWVKWWREAKSDS